MTSGGRAFHRRIPDGEKGPLYVSVLAYGICTRWWWPLVVAPTGWRYCVDSLWFWTSPFSLFLCGIVGISSPAAGAWLWRYWWSGSRPVSILQPCAVNILFVKVWLGVWVPYSTSVLHLGWNHCGVARLFGFPGSRWKVPPEEDCGGIRLLVWDGNSQVLGPVRLVQDLVMDGMWPLDNLPLFCYSYDLGFVRVESH